MATKYTPNRIETQKTTYWKYPAFERFVLKLGRKTKSFNFEKSPKLNLYKQKKTCEQRDRTFFLNCGKKINSIEHKLNKVRKKGIFVKASIRKAKHNKIKAPRSATRRTRTKTDSDKKKIFRLVKYCVIYYIFCTRMELTTKKTKFSKKSNCVTTRFIF